MDLCIVDWISYEEASKNPEDFMGGLGGFFERGMRWKDYLAIFTDECIPALEVLRQEIIDKHIKKCGDWHQESLEGVPLWSDGSVSRYTYRAWGDLMAAVWSEEDNTDYSYFDFYCQGSSPLNPAP